MAEQSKVQTEFNFNGIKCPLQMKCTNILYRHISRQNTWTHKIKNTKQKWIIQKRRKKFEWRHQVWLIAFKWKIWVIKWKSQCWVWDTIIPTLLVRAAMGPPKNKWGYFGCLPQLDGKTIHIGEDNTPCFQAETNLKPSYLLPSFHGVRRWHAGHWGRKAISGLTLSDNSNARPDAPTESIVHELWG
jgi:hypothetical protein